MTVIIVIPIYIYGTKHLLSKSDERGENNILVLGKFDKYKKQQSWFCIGIEGAENSPSRFFV
jgi:hypothetical protein